MEQQNKKAARAATKPRGNKRPGAGGGTGGRGQVTRSYTVPRRSASIDHHLDGGGDVDNGSIFYVNDAFARASGRAKKSGISSAETLAGLAGGPSPHPVQRATTLDEGCLQRRSEVDDTSASAGGSSGSGNGGAKDSWEGRLPPKCKSKASVRSLPGPGPGQNYVVGDMDSVVYDNMTRDGLID